MYIHIIGYRNPFGQNIMPQNYQFGYQNQQFGQTSLNDQNMMANQQISNNVMLPQDKNVPDSNQNNQ